MSYILVIRGTYISKHKVELTSSLLQTSHPNYSYRDGLSDGQIHQSITASHFNLSPVDMAGLTTYVGWGTAICQHWSQGTGASCFRSLCPVSLHFHCDYGILSVFCLCWTKAVISWQLGISAFRCGAG